VCQRSEREVEDYKNWFLDLAHHQNRMASPPERERNWRHHVTTKNKEKER
jgi:hypothetical protein